jgi:crotonobetainyl-CoA:carnitine CoA-transferase CaiB-like acyl-CoA transferase
MSGVPDRALNVRSYGVAAAYARWLINDTVTTVDHISALDPEGIGAFLAAGASYNQQPSLDVPPGGILLTDVPVNPESRTRIETLALESRVVWITPWGLSSEWSERPTSPLTLQAAAGWMSAVGDPDREPLSAPGSVVELVSGLFAAIEVLDEPLEPSPPGLSVVSMVESGMATLIYDPVSFQYVGRTRGRVGNRFNRAQSTLVTLPCRDGYVGIHAALHGQWLTLCDVIGHPELKTDSRFASPAERMKHQQELDEYLVPWLAERDRFEIYHCLEAARIPASPLPTLAEVLDSPQLRARNAWRDAPTPAGKVYRVPRQSPRDLVRVPGAKKSPPGGPWRKGALRIVDLSMGWAGPMVPFLLSARGADVIKVESHRRFDWWRGSRPPGDDPSLALHERSAVFNSVNRGKRGITLDLTTPEGNRLARELISTADVVVENYSAGVLEKLNLGYESLAESNPGLIMLRLPGFGSSGPEGSYLAFGNTIEGMSGLTSLVGYPGGPPTMLSNAFGDPIGGLNGTVAVLQALAARERDGHGRCIEVSQLEGFLPMVAEALVAYQRTGVLPERSGNRHAGFAPSGVYPCAGTEQWLAVAVPSDEAWAALAAFPGLGWAADTELRSAAGRVLHADSIDERLALWTRGLPRDEAVSMLMAAGIPAAPVLNESELFSFPPVQDNGFFVGEERAVVGYHLYPSLPVVRDHARVDAGRPAPTLGQHNAEVLSALGLTQDEIAALEANGIIGAVPA